LSDAQIYLWPMFGFFLIAAAGAAWQWRNPRAEAAARERYLERNFGAPRWRQMPKWGRYWSQQQDPAQLRRSAGRRAIAFILCALTLLAMLTL
jgi:hypothetical protein